MPVDATAASLADILLLQLLIQLLMYSVALAAATEEIHVHVLAAALVAA